MTSQVRLWRIGAAESLHEIPQARLDLEGRLETWLEKDISILDPNIFVIGRQVTTDFGGCIDLLCLDRDGDVVVVELKRDKTPREITAQVLDYGSWVRDLSGERVTEIAETHLGSAGIEEAFHRLGTDVPDTLNGDHRLVVVASQIDPSSERIIRYLSEAHGVNINAATFHYFKSHDGAEHLARIFLIEPEQVERQSRTQGSSKRMPNLTYEELESVADQNGVGDLYASAESVFGSLLQKHTKRNSIGFAANLEGSRKNVISLIPQESSRTTGVRFQIYIHRLAAAAGLSDDAATALLPPNRTPWIYYPTAGPDFEGFEGFFTARDEIERIAKALNASRRREPALA